jgi:hypothetical protein
VDAPQGHRARGHPPKQIENCDRDTQYCCQRVCRMQVVHKVGARFGQGVDPLSATNQQNGYAIVKRSCWLAVF